MVKPKEVSSRFESTWIFRLMSGSEKLKRVKECGPKLLSKIRSRKGLVSYIKRNFVVEGKTLVGDNIHFYLIYIVQVDRFFHILLPLAREIGESKHRPRTLNVTTFCIIVLFSCICKLTTKFKIQGFSRGVFSPLGFLHQSKLPSIW